MKARRGGASASKLVQDKAGKAEQLARVQRSADLREVLSSGAGRRFVWGQIVSSGTFGPVFTGNSETFYRDGKRAVGIKLMQEAQEVAPELYVLMLTESMQAAQEARLQRESVERAILTPDEEV